jgi:N-acetylmuramoyl-L-alanine amidase
MLQIMLDAGHGYNTPGKRSPDGLREYEFNRAVASHARNLLRNYRNVTVHFAHSDERDIPLQERTSKANSLNVDVYVSIHANAFGSGGWNNVGGIETFVHPSRPSIAYQLARKIQRNLTAATGLADRGVKTADFHVLRETRMDAVLAECGFMTNRNEARLMRTDTYRRTVAEAIVKALADQFGLVKTDGTAPAPSPSPSPPAPGGLYKVQTGAFGEKKNADQLANQLRQNGYEAFVNASSADGLFRVQAGAFSEKQRADALAAQLRQDGYSTYVYRE